MQIGQTRCTGGIGKLLTGLEDDPVLDLAALVKVMPI